MKLQIKGILLTPLFIILGLLGYLITKPSKKWQKNHTKKNGLAS